MNVIIGLVPLVMAIVYVIRPTERHLALMRPLSLGSIFGSLTGVVVGVIMVLRFVGVTDEFATATYQRIAVGLSEALIPVFVGFGCLTAAWLLVAIGMRRSGG
jgi:hypothetical protein